ncbi:hypothetical protein [Brasilonema sp. UFV-L1]|uniref:hypothetical protein n=1 Tax=Brasilonema sp. UFV-L1 TaxID=2234130 RepID=UPI00145F03C5|nr:hypothetical protein [Brasilonema sp. UFV-L1]NMG10434.1 hypothetical protein [Brasilonema sp. UFV-L1]
MFVKIYAPNVHLFAFHLKDSNQPNLLWDKCNYLLSQKFGVTKPLEIEEHEGYRVDLLKNQTDDDVSLHFESTVYQNGTPLPIAGFATPLRIHDTYVLTLNLRRPEFDENQKKTNPVELNFLELLNPSGCLMPSEMGSSLSQTILLSVWYTPDKQWLPSKSPQNRQQLRRLADNCLREFIPNNYSCPNFNQEGQLFGSPIFEYGVPTHEEDYCHVLVWVYCESETSEKFVNNYNNFVNLFHFLNKTVAAYHRSRKVYQVIRHDYQEIETYLDDVFQKIPVDKTLNEAELQQFKQYLKDIPQKYLSYSQLIRDLDQYRLTIEINAQNYKREIRDIQSQLPTEDVSFLSSFFDEDCRLFIEQIQSDLGYFQHGAALLEKAMTAIQGRVEIEQAESDRTTQDLLHQKEESDKVRDRDLQTTIAMVGVGLGAAGIGASTAVYIIPQQPTKPISLPFTSNQLHPLTQSLLFSLFCGVVGVIIGGGLSYLIQNRSAITGRIFKFIRAGSSQTVVSPGSQQTLLQGEKQNK